MRARDCLSWGVRLGVTIGVIQALIEGIVLVCLPAGLLLAPHALVPTQAYDYAVKVLLLLVPGEGTPLDSFIGPAWVSRAALAGELLLINVAVGGALGFVAAAATAAVQRARRAAWGSGAVLAILMSFGGLIHLATWVASVPLPKTPSLYQVAMRVAWSFVWDGVGIAVVVLAITAILGGRSARRGWVLGPLPAAVAGSVAALALAMWIVAGVAGGPPLAAASDVASITSPSRPGNRFNVLLISIDSLRADHLHSYGYERETSPVLDALAARGTRFERASSVTSWTLPAHMSLLTSRSILGHGILDGRWSLSPSVPTLAEAMRAAGYSTAGFVSGDYLRSEYGFDHGFDVYDDRSIRFATMGESWREITSPRLHKAVAGWLVTVREPFFLFVHYWDVHYDYIPPPPYNTLFDPDYEGSVDGRDFYYNPRINPGMDQRDLDHVIALYDGEIRYVDGYIGRLLALLEDVGVRERTLIVVTADHGDEFFEHGNKGHHRTLYEEVLHVPLIMVPPAGLPAVPTVSEPVSLLDVFPTVCDYAGVAQPQGIQGRSLRGAIEGRALAERPVTAELYKKRSFAVLAAYRLGDRKLVYNFNRYAGESYDLGRDWGERHPTPPMRSDEGSLMPEMLAWLGRQWQLYRSLDRKAAGKVVLDKETRERLRALGYLE